MDAHVTQYRPHTFREEQIDEFVDSLWEAEDRFPQHHELQVTQHEANDGLEAGAKDRENSKQAPRQVLRLHSKGQAVYIYRVIRVNCHSSPDKDED